MHCKTTKGNYKMKDLPEKVVIRANITQDPIHRKRPYESPDPQGAGKL